MPRKLALKRLTASDLTLFKWHFHNRPAGNQKAFNLDSRILTGSFYPQLGMPSDIPNPRYPIDLYLLGPGLASNHNLQRKIIRQKKNWRLNGEMIDSPDGEPARYNVLTEGDYALIELSGDLVPNMAKILLIASAVAEDAALHAELQKRYPDGSMWQIQEQEILSVLEVFPVPVNHPLSDWIGSDAVEDAVSGGTAGREAINKRRTGRGMSPEEFLRSRKIAEQTGISGEEFLNDYFEEQLETGLISSFEWTSSINAISPFDFRVTLPDGEERLVDAKSTAGSFVNPIHFSLSELKTAVLGPHNYDVYRLYEVTESSAKLRISRDVGVSLAEVLTYLTHVKDGIVVDSISIDAKVLTWQDNDLVLSSSS